MDREARITVSIIAGSVMLAIASAAGIAWLCEPSSAQKALAAKYDELRLDEARRSSDNCLKRGKVVVRSSWDGRIVDCK